MSLFPPSTQSTFFLAAEKLGGLGGFAGKYTKTHRNKKATNPNSVGFRRDGQAFYYSNLSGRSCYLDLKPNSCNLLMRKCVAARGEN